MLVIYNLLVIFKICLLYFFRFQMNVRLERNSYSSLRKRSIRSLYRKYSHYCFVCFVYNNIQINFNEKGYFGCRNIRDSVYIPFMVLEDGIPGPNKVSTFNNLFYIYKGRRFCLGGGRIYSIPCRASCFAQDDFE